MEPNRAAARKASELVAPLTATLISGKILADQEVADWLHDTMLLEVDTMSVEDVEAHVENVKNITTNRPVSLLSSQVTTRMPRITRAFIST